MPIPHRSCNKHTFLFTFLFFHFFFIFYSPRSFLCMVRYRIYSVHVYFGLNAEVHFLFSHPIILRRYVFVLRHPPDMFGSEHICRCLRRCPRFFSRFPPAFLRRRRHHRLLPYPGLSFFRFCTIFSFPFNLSRRISSQLPLFPSRPRKQCLFFG